MASAPMTPTPPPSSGAGGAPVSPTAPTAASPAPASPSPQMQQGTGMLLNVVSGLRSIAKAYPATAGKIAEVNSLMREIAALMMEGQRPGEPAAPPA